MTKATIKTEAGDLATLVERVNECLRDADELRQELAATVAEIKDRHFKDNAKGFLAFCKKTWGWERAQALRIVRFDKTRKQSPIGYLLTNEAQAREVAPYPPELHVPAAEEIAAAGQTPTAQAFRDTLAKLSAKDQAAAEAARIRAQEERAKNRGNRQKAKAWIDRVRGWANRGRNIFRQEVGTEEAEALISQLVAIAERVAA